MFKTPVFICLFIWAAYSLLSWANLFVSHIFFVWICLKDTIDIFVLPLDVCLPLAVSLPLADSNSLALLLPIVLPLTVWLPLSGTLYIVKLLPIVEPLESTSIWTNYFLLSKNLLMTKFVNLFFNKFALNKYMTNFFN